MAEPQNIYKGIGFSGHFHCLTWCFLLYLAILSLGTTYDSTSVLSWYTNHVFEKSDTWYNTSHIIKKKYPSWIIKYVEKLNTYMIRLIYTLHLHMTRYKWHMFIHVYMCISVTHLYLWLFIFYMFQTHVIYKYMFFEFVSIHLTPNTNY